ncbi:cysteine synthase OS=Rhodanobacter lindaniclasticus OX=75310 GN=B1991_10205 PE=4 SV=1 [Rhodanobacter lindaniclasticus]
MTLRFGTVSNNILDAIGDTPLLHLDGIYAKIEFLNPSGSIKARIAKYMIERAEREGLLKPGDTIVEATSGNTGNALSMVAAVKGYRMLVVMPEGLSSERVAISRALGAEVLFCGNFHVNEALARAKQLGEQPGYFCPSQLESELNVEENREILGPEILAQLPAGCVPDALVLGVGTGGTLIGVARRFARSIRRCGCSRWSRRSRARSSAVRSPRTPSKVFPTASCRASSSAMPAW